MRTMKSPVCEAGLSNRLWHLRLGSTLWVLLGVNDTKTETKAKHDHLREEENQWKMRVLITSLYRSCYTQGTSLTNMFSCKYKIKKEKGRTALSVVPDPEGRQMSGRLKWEEFSASTPAWQRSQDLPASTALKRAVASWHSLSCRLHQL